jgi:hypothetical protein
LKIGCELREKQQLEKHWYGGKKDRALLQKTGLMPWPTGIEVAAYIHWNVSVNERLREDIVATHVR